MGDWKREEQRIHGSLLRPPRTMTKTSPRAPTVSEIIDPAPWTSLID